MIREEILSKYTTFKVGGYARYFFMPDDLDDLSNVVSSYVKNNSSVLWLGCGSNLLVSDKGFNGLVVYPGKLLSYIDMHGQDVIDVGSSTTISSFLNFCVKNNLSGCEFMSGIPGTIGGALKMNAGAHGDSIWNYVESVTVLMKDGDIGTFYKKDFLIEYRKISLNITDKDFWFLSCTIKLFDDDGFNIKNRIRKFVKYRIKNHPTNPKSCGSVFKNPADSTMKAGMLIEKAGLKGYKIGGAVISKKHANFILNDGSASANDIFKLIRYIKKVIFEKFNIVLNSEVEMVGKFYDDEEKV